ncbi:MAG: ParB/RepB/Spo0J family partition protein [Sutterella sp.]|nr:ParB/RepB/Spo0J family partition protein [Sutterella sp.]
MVAKKQKRGLGRGLKSLLGDDVPAVATAKDVITDIDINMLVAGTYQPRSRMEMERLKELADSIREQGVINPIVVRPIKGGKYEIIAGERRFRASKLADRKTVPAIVRRVQDKDALAMALIENMQREDLNAMEEALGIKRLIDEFGYTHEQAAQAIGRSRPATSNLLRLLALAKPVQRMLADAKLEMGHARALLSLTGAEQIQLANLIVAKSLSVREAERLSEKRKEEKTTRPAKRFPNKTRDDQILEEKLSEALGAPVRLVVGRRGKGQIVVDFADLDDLDAIVAKICPDD